MTVQNVRVVGVDPAASLLLIEGAVPGPEQGIVTIQKSKKRYEVVKVPQAVVIVGEEEWEEATTKKAKTPPAKKK